MSFRKFKTTVFLMLIAHVVLSQDGNRVMHLFPEGTVLHSNVPYAKDTLRKHTLDVYLPARTKGKLPVVVWIHGGAWWANDKYADMSYMKETIRGFLSNGYALASIDYRFSTTAPFPAQIQDCHQALQFLSENSGKYSIDRNRIAVIGFSAGGHLASLLGVSLNNDVKSFYPGGVKPTYQIRAVIDFYGPSDLIAIAAPNIRGAAGGPDPVSTLLGADPIARPDLARIASPITYIDKADPPFFIVQGEKDESVPNTQSRLLSSWLTLSGVGNELVIVPDAPHYGPMFDEEWIRTKLFSFLRKNL